MPSYQIQNAQEVDLYCVDKDCVKATFKQICIPVENWQDVYKDWWEWEASCQQGMQTLENNQARKLKKWRQGNRETSIHQQSPPLSAMFVVVGVPPGLVSIDIGAPTFAETERPHGPQLEKNSPATTTTRTIIIIIKP